MTVTWTCRCGQVNTASVPCSACLNPPPEGTILGATPRRAAYRVPLALAVIVALLLTVGIGGAVVVRTDDSSRGATPRPGASSEQPPPADLTALVADLSRFVEGARGLSFKEPVEVVLLANDDFKARLLENAELDATEIDTTARVLAALGLIEPDINLKDAIEDLLGAAVVGFYDPETRELVVRGADPTPGVRITLVHELTHALQDQHFELHRPALDDADDESGQAFSGLVEGDASRIEDLYRDSLSNAEIKAAEREQVEQSAAAFLGIDIPRVLVQIIVFPYLVGPDFVDALLGAEPGRLDVAFAEPPTTSEHLIHPERFLAGEGSVTVTPPAADGEVIDEGVLGELGLRLMFGGGPGADVAANGWGGDWYVAWDDGDVTCVRADLVMDSPTDAAELRDALDAWAADHPDATVSGQETVRFTACA